MAKSYILKELQDLQKDPSACSTAGMEPSIQEERGAGKNKRKWSSSEDEKLVEALMDLHNAGTHRTNNGFKAGYLVVLENALLTKLPRSGIKGKPHIESRIKILKRDFSTIYDMIHGSNTSSFGWDYERHFVTAEQPVWDAYVQVHKNAAQWKSRHFPHFVDLSIIFGKDRATGKNAQSAADVVEELDRDEENVDVRGDGVEYMNEMPSPIPTSTPTTTSEECTSQRSNRKRSRSLDNLIECITNCSNMIGTHLQEAAEKFSRAISVDLDIMEQKKRINAEIAKVSGITTTQQYQAAKIIAKDEDLMVLFFTLPEGARDEWVALLLRGDI